MSKDSINVSSADSETTILNPEESAKAVAKTFGVPLDEVKRAGGLFPETGQE